MKRRPRFSVQAVLLGVTFTALCLACWQAYSSWYRQHHGDEFINRQLARTHNGDSVVDVAARLGVEGIDLDADTSLGNGVARMFRDWCAARESGLLESDQLLNYSVGRYGVTLQFREGKLINHDPTEFTNVGRAVSIDKLRNTRVGDQIAQLVAQMGVPQAIASVVLLITMTLAIVVAKKRQYSAIFLKSMIAIPAGIGSAIICLAAKVEPVSLGLVIAGFAGAVGWNLAGYLTHTTGQVAP